MKDGKSLAEKIKKQRKRWEKFTIGLIGIGLAIIGAGMLFLYYTLVNDSNLDGYLTVIDSSGNAVQAEYLDTKNNVLGLFLYNGGIIFITLGFGSLLLELYGYTTYFQKRISEVFTEKEMLNFLTEDYKNQLKHNVFESIYSPNTEDSKEILSLFDDSLAKLLLESYYDNFDLKVELSTIDDKYLVKHFVRSVEIREINTKKKNYYQDVIDIYCEGLDDDNIHPFEVESISIDGELLPKTDYDITKDPDETGEEGEQYIWHYSCKLNKAVEIHEKILVDVIYKTIVPISDTTFSFKIDTLCKDFRCIFISKDKDLDLNVVGFNFSPTQKPFLRASREGWKSIRAQGWLLPGEGVLCSSTKKG